LHHHEEEEGQSVSRRVHLIMALHSKSKECYPPQVELFDTPNTQYVIEKVTQLHVYPTNSIDGEDKPIDFRISGIGNAFYNMRAAKLWGLFQILKKDGTTIKSKPLVTTPVTTTAAPAAPATPGGESSQAKKTTTEVVPETRTGSEAEGTDIVGVMDLFASGWILALVVKTNGTQLHAFDKDRIYKEYIHVRSSYGRDAMATHLKLQLVAPDTPGFFDDLQGKNLGLVERRKITDNSALFEMLCPLNIDEFGSERYIVNNVPIDIQIIRRPSAFCLMADRDEYQVKVHQLALIVPEVHLAPSMLKTITERLAGNETAKYPYKRREIKTFKIGGDETIKVVDGLWTGPQPNNLGIMFIEEAAYGGRIEKNPLKFLTLDIESLSVNSAGEQFPSMAFKPNVEEPGRNALLYASTSAGTGIHDGDEGHSITKEAFMNGSMIIFLDLSQDRSVGQGTHWNQMRLGNFRIELVLKKAPRVPVMGLVYGEFDALMQIDKDRKATVSA